jgi:hypothetical protein
VSLDFLVNYHFVDDYFHVLEMNFVDNMDLSFDYAREWHSGKAKSLNLRLRGEFVQDEKQGMIDCVKKDIGAVCNTFPPWD